MRQHFDLGYRAVWVTCVFSMMLVLSITPSTYAQGGEDDRRQLQAQDQQRIRAAVDALTNEANDLENLGDVAHPAVTRRPHPLVREIPDRLAPAVLSRMLRPFTGNQYRDSYIRWHLMDVVNRASDEDLRTMGSDLQRLLGMMPPSINIPWQSEWQDEPQDIARQYWRLHNQSRYTEGYPPFQRVYFGRQALERATGAERERIAPLVAEMERLRPQWRRIHDREAIAFNDRANLISWLIRQYRGEVVYALLASGDPRAFDLVLAEVGRQARASQLVAFDMMAFLYKAYLDGQFAKYDNATLERASRDLLSTGRQFENYHTYLDGEREQPWDIGVRSLGDNVAHMVYALRRREELPAPIAIDPPARITGSQRSLSQNAPLTLDIVQEAIGRGKNAIYRLEPEWTFRPSLLVQIRRQSRHRYNQEVVHEMGNHALACWSLLELGEPIENAWLFRRISWVLGQDRPFVFDRAMRENMLANMPPDFWASWVRRDFIWMREAMTDQGSFPINWRGGPSTGYQDNTQAFYGVMGLWAAARSGQVAPRETWERINRYWREGQLDNGAWALVSTKVEDGDRAPNPVMTAAGVAALTISQQYIQQGNTRPGVPQGQAELQKGIDWLNRNFRVNDPRAEDDWFFYMWIVQQVGHATGYRTFNGVDWQAAVTREILNRQQTDGSWTGPQGRIPSTAFALLYLSQANSAVGVAKLQHDGGWNNYPQDIYHFAQFASDRFEMPITWQFVSPSLRSDALLESPILYLSTSGPFEFNQQQLANLRGYVRRGGMIVVNLESGGSTVQQSLRKMVEAVCGEGAQIETMSSSHPLFSVNLPVRPNAAVQVVQNGVRPQIIIFPRDLGGGLQANRTTDDAFALLTNAYVYAKGQQPNLGRLEEAGTFQIRSFNPRQTVTAARLMYGPQADPEPVALERLQAVLGNDYRVRLNVESIAPDQLSSNQKIAFMAVAPDAELTDAQAQAIRQWVEQGGTLWMDALGGSDAASRKMYDLLQKIAPNEGRDRLPNDSPILTGRIRPNISGENVSRVIYRRYALFSGFSSSTHRLQVVRINNRPAIYLSNMDLTAGLAGLHHWNIFGYSPESATGILVNAVLDVAFNR